MTDFNPARSHIPSLDGVRALAILSVLVVHAFYRGPDSGLTGLAAQAVILGWSGVDLFFVLSGFLITSILLDAKGMNSFFRDFYVKRFGRIFPLYYSILVVFLSLYFVDVPKVAPMIKNYVDHWWAYFLFISNLGDIFGWGLDNPLSPAWSLAVEEQYYLVWPLLVWLLDLRSLKKIAPALLFSFAILRFFLIGRISPDGIYHFTLTHADGILTGSIIALYRDEISRNVGVVRIGMIVISIFLIATFIEAGTTHYQNPIVQKFGFLLIALFYGCFLVLAIADRRLSYVLSSRWLGTIGKYSYCIYLIHWPLLLLLDQLPFPGGVFAWSIFVLAFIAAVTGMAAVSWVVLEKPASLLVRRIGLARTNAKIAGGLPIEKEAQGAG